MANANVSVASVASSRRCFGSQFQPGKVDALGQPLRPFGEINRQTFALCLVRHSCHPTLSRGEPI